MERQTIVCHQQIKAFPSGSEGERTEKIIIKLFDFSDVTRQNFQGSLLERAEQMYY